MARDTWNDMEFKFFVKDVGKPEDFRVAFLQSFVFPVALWSKIDFIAN